MPDRPSIPPSRALTPSAPRPPATLAARALAAARGAFAVPAVRAGGALALGLLAEHALRSATNALARPAAAPAASPGTTPVRPGGFDRLVITEWIMIERRRVRP